MVPLICKEGLLDYEVLIRNKFCKKFTEIQKFIAENKIVPIYIIVKKLFKSKKKFFYNFNNNGYSVAIAFHLKELDELKKNKLNQLLKEKKLLLNLSKTDLHLIKKTKKIHSNKNEIFMSLYKKKLISGEYEISR